MRHRRLQSGAEPDELHRDLDHQPVVAAEIDAREVADSPQPLPQRVRMDEEGLGRAADVAPPPEELLEGREQ